MTGEEIIARLPYTQPFLFVDNIQEVSKTHIVGSYCFTEDSDFYQGHFKDNPVTPGVILTECMAQIGLVSLGIYLLQDQSLDDMQIAFTEANTQFLKPVFPNEKVTVHGEVSYFRFNKLKCKVQMLDTSQEVVCTGELAGIFKL